EIFVSRAAQLAPSLLARRTEASRERLANLDNRLLQTASSRTAAQREKLARFATLLEAYSYQGVLQRGFALVRDGQGLAIRNVAAAAAATTLDIQFADGHFVTGTSLAPAA